MRALAAVCFAAAVLAACMPTVTRAIPLREQLGGSDGTVCVACTLVVSIIEQLASIENQTVDHELEKFCQRLPAKLQPACKVLVDTYGPAIINRLEKKDTPDVVCHAIDLCTNAQCRLFPPPPAVDFEVSIKKAKEEVRVEGLLPNRLSLPAICDLPVIKDICNFINNWAGNHDPLDDIDKDGFSTTETFRGTDWRGRDCDDTDGTYHPGRVPEDNDRVRDSNCNGIFGVDPVTGKTYEELFCANTGELGVIVLGDSASAHFHVPEQYMEPLYIATHVDTYHNLVPALENEFDWPMFSATTAFMNDTEWAPDIAGPVNSTYMLFKQRNRCNHRDYQNLGVNGARSGSMNDSIQASMSRIQKMDKPAFVLYALIGNDVCNGHEDTVSDMTTPEEMRANALSTLEFLETRLPAGSAVMFMGLADGRILYDALKDRLHPIGQYRQDVTYPMVYDYLNCLSISPCRGWMNTNATLRNITTERAQNLSAVLQNLAATSSYSNFKTYYIDNPINQALAQWEAKGGEAWQLIEPVDGFHPNQLAQALIVNVVWTWVQQNHPELMPAVNPNNGNIKAVFGDQGGY